mmetsp:Transcript_9141/g.19773  ORF Transcript_9141/g.19773 Transcript_9141/m.19773 type:complete len:100 (+) Transcript_9141:197-496(+)
MCCSVLFFLRLVLYFRHKHVYAFSQIVHTHQDAFIFSSQARFRAPSRVCIHTSSSFLFKLSGVLLLSLFTTFPFVSSVYSLSFSQCAHLANICAQDRKC